MRHLRTIRDITANYSSGDFVLEKLLWMKSLSKKEKEKQRKRKREKMSTKLTSS